MKGCQPFAHACRLGAKVSLARPDAEGLRDLSGSKGPTPLLAPLFPATRMRYLESLEQTA